MYSFQKNKNALKQSEEERQEILKKDIEKVRAAVEKFLTMAMENTASVARTQYSGLEMF